MLRKTQAKIAAELYRRGLSINRISQKMQLNYRTVRKVVKNLGNYELEDDREYVENVINEMASDCGIAIEYEANEIQQNCEILEKDQSNETQTNCEISQETAIAKPLAELFENETVNSNEDFREILLKQLELCRNTRIKKTITKKYAVADKKKILINEIVKEEFILPDADEIIGLINAIGLLESKYINKDTNYVIRVENIENASSCE